LAITVLALGRGRPTLLSNITPWYPDASRERLSCADNFEQLYSIPAEVFRPFSCSFSNCVLQDQLRNLLTP
jgi:hypothetical protein